MIPALLLSLAAHAHGDLPEVADDLDLPGEGAAVEDRSPRVRLGLIDAGGDARAPEVRRVVRQRLHHLVYCADRMAAAGIVIQGPVHLRFVLLPDGAAEDVGLAVGQLRVEEFDACLAPLVERWPLPEGGPAVDVDITYDLRAPLLGIEVFVD